MYQGLRIGHFRLWEPHKNYVEFIYFPLNDLLGFCGSSGCGEYGKCSFNDTCVCEPGYFGHRCQDMREYIMFSRERLKRNQEKLHGLWHMFDAIVATSTDY